MKSRLFFLFLSFTILASCAAFTKRELHQDTVAKYLAYAGKPINRFSYLGGFDEWRAVGRDRVFIRTGFNNAYLLTLAQPCFELHFANTIGVSSVGHTVSRLDAVHVRGQRCQITEILPIDYREMKQAQRAG